jgi:transglutaminase-like putative cysteine protease
MTYRYGVTGVRTTAAEALALGAGVCQDYAHVMLALCRVCGLPARYVSGHLLGQGGTHAWVEVVLPAMDGTGEAVASAFDPTHASRGGLGYVTIAVGADYGDVAPTSGSYTSSSQGRLTTSKRVTLTGLE